MSDENGASLRLVPEPSRKQYSVAKVDQAWYVACFSDELEQKPIARTLLGTPIVLFRGADGEPAALLDRCPHRNVPLSLGSVVEGQLQCAYHGWCFDGRGACQKVPGLLGKLPSARADAFAVREQDGCVWVWMRAGDVPSCDPFRMPLVNEPGYDTVCRRVSAHGTMHATIENALDVPHTAFLHKGLFRGTSEPNDIEVVVRREADRVEAEYIGEPRPTGLVGRLLSPSGGVVTHYDRFILPSLLQVEYRIGDENHILVTGACTPVSDFFTELYAVVSFRLNVPHRLVKPVLLPIALRIFAQDAAVLERQTETIRRFGGESFASTQIDVLGHHIWRLLRKAERACAGQEAEPAEADGQASMQERRFTMRA